MYVSLFADILKDLRPYGYTDLSDVRFLEQIHIGSGLSDAAANTEWNIVIHDCLVIRLFQEIKLSTYLKLLFESIPGDPYAHRRQFVTAFCHGVPYKNITV